VLDVLFAAGGALWATFLIYGAWLCLRELLSSLRDLLAGRARGATEHPMRKQKQA